MKNILIATILMDIVLLSDCKKTPTAHHDPIDSFLVQNFNYKPGTYWIYRDSITAEEDSFFVSDNVFSSTPNPQNSGDLTDNIQINILQYHLNAQAAKWTMNMSYSGIYMGYSGNIEISYALFIFVPYKVGLLGYDGEDSGYVVSINNNYIFKSNTYNDLVIIKHINYSDTIYPKHNNTFYFNSEVGILKMVLNQDIHNIWEVDRYKIVK